MQQSPIFKVTLICCFYRFNVNLYFASAAFFAPVIPSCIRYPSVPVCKKCAKMCRVKISPLKQVSDFYAKPEKRPGSSPIRQLQSCLFRSSIKCTSTTTIHGRDLDNQTATTLHRLSVICSEHRFLHSPPEKIAGRGCPSCLSLPSAAAQHGCSFWGSPKPLLSIFRSGRTAYRCIHP